MNTYSYSIDGKIYINLTNRCSNACDFCVRVNDSYSEHSLWLDKEPTTEEVINSFQKLDFDGTKEFVFCGYGEPTYKLNEILEISEYLHKHGKIVRLNTNGQADLILGESVAPKLKGYIDIISISLNASNAKAYQDICHSEFGEKAFYALLNFAKECKEYVPVVKVSLVDVVGEEEIKKAKELCESIGIDLRIRAYIS
ncbi:MAG: TatD family nuclease-associated radical SAM protein [Clostridia bacterium]|nr:TatD family nuclease-associated radical SAM protein [Clostridia bacterium]